MGGGSSLAVSANRHESEFDPIFFAAILATAFRLGFVLGRVRLMLVLYEPRMVRWLRGQGVEEAPEREERW
jgi:hypothetical protein